MNAILGGLFTSRINLNLREDKGWTYGARSGILLEACTRPVSWPAPPSILPSRHARSRRCCPRSAA